MAAREPSRPDVRMRPLGYVIFFVLSFIAAQLLHGDLVSSLAGVGAGTLALGILHWRTLRRDRAAAEH